MGAPSITTTITQIAKTAVSRGATGILAVILTPETTDTNAELFNTIQVVEYSSDIPDTLSDTDKAYIERGLIGADTATKYIVLVVAESVDAGLSMLTNVTFNYLVLGTNPTDDEKLATYKWVQEMRESERKMVKTVLAHSDFDSEGVVNFTTDDISTSDGSYSASEFCSRVAGLICGTSITRSATYQPLTDVSSVPITTKAERDTRCGNGEFFLFDDGRQVKVCSGLTSYTSFTDSKGEDFSDIKFVDTLDLIVSDINNFVADDFIGKKLNTYNNKMLFVSKVNDYLTALSGTEIITSDFTVSIDSDAQKEWLREHGYPVSDMSYQEILQSLTRDEAFFSVSVQILRAMQHIVINITV